MAPMLLHEAIRLGSMQFPQAFDGDTTGEGRCALAGAAEVIGHAWWATLSERYPFLDDLAVNPATRLKSDVMSVIYRLNDVHKWSREQIADWVQPIEEAYMASQTVSASTPQPVAVAVTA